MTSLPCYLSTLRPSSCFKAATQQAGPYLYGAKQVSCAWLACIWQRPAHGSYVSTEQGPVFTDEDFLAKELSGWGAEL